MLHSHIHVHAEYILTQWTTDAMIKTQEGRQTLEDRRRKTSLLIYLPLTLLQGFEKVVWVFTVRGCWRPNITEIFWPQSYGRQRCVFLVLQDCTTGGPGPTLLGNCFLYCILSASSLDPKLHRGSRGPLWPGVASLPHLVSIPTGTRLNWPELQLAATTGSSNSTGVI